MENPYFLAVDAFLENEDGEILLIHRAEHKKILPGYYNGIGGKFEFFETPKEALLREVKEESGIEQISDIALKLILTVEDRFGLWNIWIFTGKVKKEDMRIQELEEGELEWVKKSEIGLKNLVPDVMKWHEKLFEPDLCMVKIKYDEQYQMIDYSLEKL